MLTTIVIFVVVLGLLVFVHELGHFLTAKKMGVQVDEFGFGFPPRIAGYKWRGTLYSINWIPLGGFVKIKGESGESAEDPQSFAHKSAWQKIAILTAGVGMNIALTAVLLIVGFMVGIPQEIGDEIAASQIVRDERIVIAEVRQGSAASRAGIELGDSIVSINGVIFETSDAISEYIVAHSAEELTIELQRGSERLYVDAMPEPIADDGVPRLGIGMIRAGIVRYGVVESVIKGIQATGVLVVAVVVAFWTLLAGLVTGSGAVDQVSGPVGVAVLTGQVAKLGIPYLINFTAILSVNLAILNILPFPALDGGRVLFVIIERLKGRPVNPKLESIFHNVGFGILLVLIGIITYRDLLQYGDQIWNGLRSLVG